MMKNLRYRNKQGNVQDILMLVVIMVFVIMCSIVTIKILQKVISVSQDDDSNSVQTKQDITDMGTKFYRGIDLGFLFLLIVRFISILLSAYFIDIHPLFAILGILTSIVMLIGCASLAKTAQELVEKTPEVFSQLPITTFVTNNIFVFIVIMMGLLFIVLYGKWKG
jgi:hypothetical protein